ncbi:unnamed protein product [Sphagnum troendelagicum]|uniref:Peptidase M16 C-terminal domain-containing protein n=1 Tax=Sphagnum troendelagicum TaxID=128251 RepID=A0ABP0UXG5_9BRYO
MEEVEGKVEEVMFDHLHATAFQHSSLGRSILGPAANIRSITKPNLQDYITSHYTAPRMVIAAAGAVQHEDLVSLAEKSFQSLPTNPTTASQLTMLGAWNKNAVVGKHAGSEMAQKIGANNLAESVMAFNTNYTDAGLFGVYAVAKPDTLDDLSYCIMHEMTSLIYRAAPDDVACAPIGPTQNLPDYNWFRRHTYWNRY